MIVHLDINGTSSQYSIENDVKIGGNVVNKAYFTRRLVRVQPSPGNNFVTVLLPCDVMYIITHDQTNTDEAVYVVDTVDGVAPTDLLDLASRINDLIR